MTTVAWGLNTTRGILGVGDGTTPHRSPTAMAGSVEFAQAMADGTTDGVFGIGLAADGSVYGWGDNAHGGLGQGSTDTSNHQTPISIPGISGVISVHAGTGCAYAILANHDLYTWGRNSSGQLGDGTTSEVLSPTLNTTGVAKVSTGNLHTVLLKTNGAVWTAGSNSVGQLANGNTTEQHTWQVVTPGSGTVVDIACGEGTTYLVMADGTTQGAGRTSSGQLGITDGSAHSSFISGPVTNAVAVYANNATAWYVLNDGTSWGMGANGQGLLGIGSTSPSNTNTPIQMVWPTGVLPIAWGLTETSLQNSAIALGSDNLVYTWGNGTNGQMGDGGGTLNNPTPISANGLTAINWVGGMGGSFFAGDVVLTPITVRARAWAAVIG